MFKSVWRSRVLLRRREQWVEMGSSTDKAGAMLWYMRGEKRRRDVSERRTTGVSACGTTYACA